MIPCPIAEQYIAPPVATPLLSIVVPTYNRAILLNETLTNICTQLKDGLEHKIEVVVCDNASTDATLDILRGWAENKNISFSYYHHARNMGSPAQLLLAAERCRSPYLNVFGDDDGFQPDGIATIVRALETHPVDFLTVNREMRNGDMVYVMLDRLNKVPDKAYARFEDLLRDFSICQLGLWCSHFMRPEFMRKLDPDYYADPDKVGRSGFSHLVAYIEAFRGASDYFLSEPAVIHRNFNFADPRKTMQNSYVHMSIDLLCLFESYKARCKPDINIYEDITGVKNTDDYAITHLRKMSDFMTEFLLKSLSYGLRLSPEQKTHLLNAQKDMRPEVQAILDAAMPLAVIMEELENEARDLGLRGQALSQSTHVPPLERQRQLHDMQRRQKAALDYLQHLQLSMDHWSRLVESRDLAMAVKKMQKELRAHAQKIAS